MKTSFLLAPFVISVVLSASFEESSRRCEGKKNLDSLNKCLNQAIDEDFKLLIAKGVPELDIPVWDPGNVKDVDILLGDFSALCSGVQLRGLSKWATNTALIDAETMTMKLKVIFPELRLTGQYKLNGKILSLVMEGSGPFWTIISNVTLDFIQPLVVKVTPTGRQIQIEERKIAVDYAKMRTRLNKLFNGDAVLGETVNSFVNDNSRELFDAFMGVLNDPVSEVIFKLTNAVFAHIPADIVLGPRP